MLLGKEEARIHTPPLRELTPATSAGFAMIEFASTVLGIELYPWQKWFLIHAFELLPNGRFRFRTIVLLVARQNGKSTVAQVISLYFMYVLQVALVLGTAQNLDVAEEIWNDVVEIATNVPELADEVEDVVRATGKKALLLTSGSRYKVQAANRRGGRGLAADLVLLDELREHTKWDAWGAITKTTMARANAIVLALSNAGDYSSVVLSYLRLQAHRALGDPDGLLKEEQILPDADESVGIFEWSSAPWRDLADREGWAEANPSVGYGGLTERAISSAFKTDPPGVFATEVLCRWVQQVKDGPFPEGSWDAGVDEKSKRAAGSPVAWCVEVSWDRRFSHIVVAGMREDGVPHVEVAATRAGTEWVTPWLTERINSGRYDTLGVVVQARGAPASTLIPQLKDAGLPVVEWGGPALSTATGDFYDRVARVVTKEGDEATPGVYHLPQPLLDQAAATAVTKPSGDSWLIDRAHSPTDASPLVGAVGAVWLLCRPLEESAVSAYETAELVFLD